MHVGSEFVDQHCCIKQSVALAYVPRATALAGNRFEVEIPGHRTPAVLSEAPLYDPTGSRMRA